MKRNQPWACVCVVYWCIVHSIRSCDHEFLSLWYCILSLPPVCVFRCWTGLTITDTSVLHSTCLDSAYSWVSHSLLSTQCCASCEHCWILSFLSFFLQRDNNYYPYPLFQVKHISYQLIKAVKCKEVFDIVRVARKGISLLLNDVMTQLFIVQICTGLG